MTLANKVDQFNADADIAHEIIHGGPTTTVTTEGGPVRSFAKLMADGASSIASQLLSGTGAQVAFTLAAAPVSKNNTQVYISGAYQQKDTYSLVGTTLTFSEAPPAGTSNIEVVTIAALTVGVAGADVVTYTPAGTGAVETTVQEVLRERVSVTNKGADPTGVASSLTAFTNAYNDAAAGSTIVIPPGTYLSVSGSLTGSKFVIWQAEGTPSGGGTWNLPGIVIEGYTSRLINNVEQTSATDYARSEYRRITSHSGGTVGDVNANLRVTTQVGAGVTNFEWGFLSVLDNYATAGENCAGFSQANKKAASVGPTWAHVFEARNNTNTTDVGQLVAVEFDIFSNGADTNSNRIAADVVVGKGDAAGSTCVAFAGVRIGSQDADITKGWFSNGLVIADKNTNSINITATSDKAVRIAATTAVGIDLSESTISGSAVRLKRSDKIAFEPTDTFTMKADATVNVIRVDNAGTERVGFAIGSSGTAGVRINGITVISSQSTGWTAMTGTADKATAYDTASVTLAQLAGRVMSMQAAMTTHGLLGA